MLNKLEVNSFYYNCWYLRVLLELKSISLGHNLNAENKLSAPAVLSTVYWGGMSPNHFEGTPYVWGLMLNKLEINSSYYNCWYLRVLLELKSHLLDMFSTQKRSSLHQLYSEVECHQISFRTDQLFEDCPLAQCGLWKQISCSIKCLRTD